MTLPKSSHQTTLLAMLRSSRRPISFAAYTLTAACSLPAAAQTLRVVDGAVASSICSGPCLATGFARPGAVGNPTVRPQQLEFNGVQVAGDLLSARPASGQSFSFSYDPATATLSYTVQFGTTQTITDTSLAAGETLLLSARGRSASVPAAFQNLTFNGLAFDSVQAGLGSVSSTGPLSYLTISNLQANAAWSLEGDLIVALGNGQAPRVEIALSSSGLNTQLLAPAEPLFVIGEPLITQAADVAGDVDIRSTLVFDQDVDGDFDGTLVGTGTLEKTGDATLILSGDSSSFGGQTTVAAGTLQIAGLLAGPVDVTAGSALAVGGGLAGAITATDSTVGISGALTGDATITGGTFDLSGAMTGALDLSDSDASLTGTLAGPATVTGGSLSLNGMVEDTLTVADSTVSGTGRALSDVAMDALSILAPGNSIGTLTFGSLSFGGTYQLEYRAPDLGAPLVTSGSGESLRGRNIILDPALDPTDQDADLVVVTGATVLASTARVVLLPLGTEAEFDAAFSLPGNTNREIQYQILRSEGGITGSFVALSDGMASLEMRPAAGGGDDIWLTLSEPALPPVVIVGSAPTPFRLPMGVDRPRCDVHPSAGRTCAVLEGSLLDTDLDGDGALSGTDLSGQEGLVGLSYGFDSGLTLGIAYARSSGDLSLSDGSGSGDFSRHGGVAWATWEQGPIDLRAWLGVYDTDVSSARMTALGATARADISAEERSVAAEARYWVDIGSDLSVTPVVGLYFGELRQDGYNEQGGGAENFSAEDTTFSTSSLLLGGEVEGAVRSGTTRVDLKGGLGWLHAFGDRAPTLAGTYAGDATGTRLTSTGAASPRDSLALTLGATMPLGARTALHAGYSASVADGWTDQAVSVRLSMRF